MRRPLILFFSVIVLAALFVVLCTYVRKPYERILIDRFGKVIEEHGQVRLAYNWYFKWPTDKIVRIDTRLHLYMSPLIETATKGSEPIAVRTFAAWRITDPVKFKTALNGSDELAMDKVAAKIAGLVGSKIGARNLDELFNVDEKLVMTDKLEEQIAKEATDGSPDAGDPSGLADQGLQVVQVGFSRIAFPPSNAESIYARMAGVRVAKARTIRGEGQVKADTERSKGDTEAKTIRAEAVAEAERIKGEGDREATAILAKVQVDDASRDFYQYWKSMDFYTKAFAKNTYLVLPADSDLLKNMLVTPRPDKSSTTKPAGSR